MIDGKYHTIQKYKNKPVLIDIADLGAGLIHRYEVMAMWKNGSRDFDCKTFADLDEAIIEYHAMCDRYKDKAPQEPEPLTGKYAKLRDDLKAALIAWKAAQTGEDGGTCNFDSCALHLPRWKESLVKQAAKEAGTAAFEWSLFGSKWYVFHPDTGAQANDRSRNAEAMTLFLKALDYQTFNYQQAD